MTYEVISIRGNDEFPELETNDINEAIQKARDCDFYITSSERKKGAMTEIRDYTNSKYDELEGWDGWSLVDFKEA